MDANIANNSWDDTGEPDSRRDRALAIKACLDSLKTDARACALRDLERFLELAALAAEEAALALADPRGPNRLHYVKAAGRC